MTEWIKLQNASANNLKNISATFPKEALSIINGPVGSGKSSLIRDSILLTAERRLALLFDLPSLTVPTETSERNKVTISGLPITYGFINSKAPSKTESVGSTLGFDSLLARTFLDSAYKKCPICKTKIKATPKDNFLEETQKFVSSHPADVVTVSALIISADDTLSEEINRWQMRGFEKFIVAERELSFSSELPKDLSSCEVVVDRITARSHDEKRLLNSLRLATSGNAGTAILRASNPKENLALSLLGFCYHCRKLFPGIKHPHYSLKLDASTKAWRVSRLFSKEVIDAAWNSIFLEASDELSFTAIINSELSTIATLTGQSSITDRIKPLCDLGLGHLRLSRALSSLSHGEYQRIRLLKSVILPISHSLFLCDEPSSGLHLLDIEKLQELFFTLKSRSNTVIFADNNIQLKNVCDFELELGPGSGASGGTVLYNDTVRKIKLHNMVSAVTAPQSSYDVKAGIRLKNARLNNLQIDEVIFPKNRISVVTGVSGSGKTSLVIKTLLPALEHSLNNASTTSNLMLDAFEAPAEIERVIPAWPQLTPKLERSTVATFTGLFPHLTALFAVAEMAKMEGLTKDTISKLFEMRSSDLKSVFYKGINLYQTIDLSITELSNLLSNHPKIKKITEQVIRFNLGYLSLSQPIHTLSKAERQLLNLSLKIKSSDKNSVYLLDEPTLGFDVEHTKNLINILRAQVANGNTVILVEHNPQMILAADYIVELGPEAGARGGRLVFSGTVSELFEDKNSPTGKALRKLLS